MSIRRESPQEAVERWRREGLLLPELAERLAADARLNEEARRHRVVRGSLAATAALVLTLAAVIFLKDLWWGLGAVIQTVIILAVGVVLWVAGLNLEGPRAPVRTESGGLVAVALGLQTAGLGVLAAALAYSEAAWPAGTPEAGVAGAIALLVPVAAFAVVRGRNRVMPAVVVVASYVFCGIGLARFHGELYDTDIWILNGLFAVWILALGAALAAGLRSGSERVREEGTTRGEALLVAFTVNLYVAFPLLFLTGIEVLGLDEATFFLLDGWLVVLTGLVTWVLHAGPEPLRRAWMDRLLPVSVGLAVVLAFPTVLGALDGNASGTAGLVAAVGIAALAYGLRTPVGGMVELGCIALVVAAWTLTLSEASTLLGAASLAGTAALLFWLARRVGGRGASGDSAEG